MSGEFAGARVGVVGLGSSGLSALRYLRDQGASTLAIDAASRSTLGERAQQAEGLGASLRLGAFGAESFRDLDLLVLSPGVPWGPPQLALVPAGVRVWPEVELASRALSGARLIGVTGTNGKSTVCAMLAAIFSASGAPTFLGGNYGTPLIDVANTPAAGPGGVVVAELSSFQLEHVVAFRVDVALLLNLDPDHLDRHGDAARYFAAKGRIFERLGPQGAALVPADDPRCAALASQGEAPLHRFGAPDGEVRVEGGSLVDRVRGWQVPLSSLSLSGAHNFANAAAAALAARVAGVSADAIEAGLCGVAPLPHRFASVAEVKGVAFVNDSKATNMHAALNSLAASAAKCRRVVLIAGGRDKGVDPAPLVSALAEGGHAAVLIGEAAPLWAPRFAAAGVEVAQAGTMDDAVSRAAALARPKDTVLLAPACASFDMFPSFAARGQAFTDATLALEEAS